MKKIKNILCLSIIALCTFCMMGIVEVNAAAAATNFKVVCNPESIEKGDIASCYLLAQITNDGATGIDGFVTKVVAADSKNLVIEGVQAAPAKSSEMVAEHINNGASPTLDSGAKASAYQCNNSATSYPGCYVFYAKAGKTITGVTNFADNGSIPLTGYTGYTVIGYYDVKLSSNATLNDCGRLCVDVAYSSTGSYTDLEGNVSACAEVKPTGTPETPNTGSFTSYIVLIGGAFVAIGAIALARKNNKFFRV